MVQQMAAVNPQLAELTKRPEALQRILSPVCPEVLQKVQHGGRRMKALCKASWRCRSRQSPRQTRQTRQLKCIHWTVDERKRFGAQPHSFASQDVVIKFPCCGSWEWLDAEASESWGWPDLSQGWWYTLCGIRRLPAESALVSFGQLFDSTKNRDLFNFQLGAWESELSCVCQLSLWDVRRRAHSPEFGPFLWGRTAWPQHQCIAPRGMLNIVELYSTGVWT